MAPMAMKSILKKGALGKAKGKPVPVGKFAALGKAKAMAKSKALAKEKKALGKAKAKAKAKKLSKSNLEKLGELTLADKIKAAAELGGEDEENAACLTPDENSQVWGRHQTFLKANPLEKEEYLGKGKKEKGLAASLWLMQTAGKRFLSCRTSVGALEKVKRKEEWVSEASMLKVWSEKELTLDLQSGRVIWRQCPSTPGVWEYKDTQKFPGLSVAPGAALGKVARKANQGLSTWKSSKAFTMRRPWASMTQASSLEKEKAKALEKAALAKASPTSQGFWPCRMGRWTHQVRSQSLPQRSRSWHRPGSRPARLRPWCTSFRGSWTKPWKRSRASSPERSRPQHWACRPA